jgi:hypothetical protein
MQWGVLAYKFMMDTFLARRSTLITLAIKTKESARKKAKCHRQAIRQCIHGWKTRREIGFNFVAYRAKEKTRDIVDQLDQVSPQST